MIALLGKTVTRFWPLLLGAWLLLLAVSWRFAPAWDEVTQTGDIPSLPANTPSRRGEQLFKTAFPDAFSQSSIVLVLSREEDGTELLEQDKKFIDEALTPALKKLVDERNSTDAGRGEPIIARIRSPEDQGVGALLVSRDKQAALVVVELTTPFLDNRNGATIGKIEEVVARLRRDKEVPSRLQIAITGSATAGRDMKRAEQKSAHDVEVWTIVVVVLLLILTYRAPLVALIPLATVFVAVQISLKVLALLGEAQIVTLSRDLRIFITVIAYGAGVDYCVFLIARYQEELDAGSGVKDAVSRAIARAGGAVGASAATVICGIGMLAFAQLGKIHVAGLIIPLSLCLVLGAALTFAPSLLRLMGRWVFWPQSLTTREAEGRSRGPIARFLGRLTRHNLLPDVWGRIGSALLRRPGLIWLTTVAIMTPFAVVAVLLYNKVNYDPLSGLPDSAPSVAGSRMLERYFPPGLLGSVTLLLQNDKVDFESDKGVALIRELTEQLKERKDSLALADVRSVAKPLGITDAAQEAVARLGLPPSLVESAIRKRALDYYVSHAGEEKGHVTRIDLVLAVPPLSPQGIEYLDRIEHSLETDLPEGLRHGSQVSFCGPAATVRDLRTVTRSDQMRVQILVPLAIFVLLLIVFRQVGLSLYLILSVLFSYLVTLGTTFLVFWLIEGQAFAGLDWKVPLFLFTILVAVGEDYNIFLMTRVEEERRARGPLQGIVHALARTGRIISTCGFIMAGTFAALFAGAFVGMKQLGFALAVGVLLDTLVVRPILVPTFWILFQGRKGDTVGTTSETPTRPEQLAGSAIRE